MTFRNASQFITMVATLVTSAACAHGALVESDPPGAELYVNGTQVGITPYTIQDTVGSGERYEIVLKKQGYAIVQETLIQDQFSWPRGIASVGCGACTLGVGCLGLMWSWQLQDKYTYVLDPVGAESSPAPVDGATPELPPEPTDEDGSDPQAKETVPI